jgi:hypothetical protein
MVSHRVMCGKKREEEEEGKETNAANDDLGMQEIP